MPLILPVPGLPAFTIPGEGEPHIVIVHPARYITLRRAPGVPLRHWLLNTTQRAQTWKVDPSVPVLRWEWLRQDCEEAGLEGPRGDVPPPPRKSDLCTAGRLVVLRAYHDDLVRGDYDL